VQNVVALDEQRVTRPPARLPPLSAQRDREGGAIVADANRWRSSCLFWTNSGSCSVWSRPLGLAALIAPRFSEYVMEMVGVSRVRRTVSGRHGADIRGVVSTGADPGLEHVQSTRRAGAWAADFARPRHDRFWEKTQELLEVLEAIPH